MSGPGTAVVTSRIDAECRRQGVSAALLARVAGISYGAARALRGARNQKVMLPDVIRAAAALDVAVSSWFTDGVA